MEEDGIKRYWRDRNENRSYLVPWKWNWTGQTARKNDGIDWRIGK